MGAKLASIKIQSKPIPASSNGNRSLTRLRKTTMSALDDATRRRATRAPRTGARERPSNHEPTSRATPSLTISRPELLSEGTDRKFRQLVHALFGFLATHETIRAGHAKFIGLAGIEYTVLISIGHLSQDGEVNVSTVASHLHLTGAFITTVCQRLLALGLIRKEIDPKDRRRVTLTVSPEGRRRLDALAPVQRQVNDAEFACLSREEFLSLLDMVERLIGCGERAVALQRYLQAGMDADDRRAQRSG
jgi:DNA-binding MarR family transcriptional regulator